MSPPSALHAPLSPSEHRLSEFCRNTDVVIQLNTVKHHDCPRESALSSSVRKNRRTRRRHWFEQQITDFQKYWKKVL